MVTTHRSDLVDEIEKALRDEAYDGGFGYMGDEQFTAYVRTLAVAAAKVVEEAHTPTAGSCWDAAPLVVRAGECDPAPTLCELTAGHQGAHRSGQTEWMHTRPLTPTDDEREALRAEAEKVQRAAWAEIHGQDPSRTYSVAEVKRLVYSFDNVLSSALRRFDVPEPSAEATLSEVRSHAERFASRPPTSPYSMGLRDAWRTILRKIDGIPTGAEVPEPSADTCEHCGRPDGNHMLIEPRLTIKLAPEPQGEPSDARRTEIEARALEGFLGKLAGDGAYTLDFSSAANLHDHIAQLLKRDIAALRAAGGVR
ncbi:hypothetical protein [Microbacterium algeriense]|uniref:DUF222 domain-containing protein n=1 Tax=Microbacterium algeriense TaxID=2615184 RepID=A0ABQ6VAT2_9MICO|nr:hypothetical protein [Microbacterium algeriense]KAB1867318.1 hypothetical protein F6A08_05900 [Microbacterium algeriense]